MFLSLNIELEERWNANAHVSVAASMIRACDYEISDESLGSSLPFVYIYMIQAMCFRCVLFYAFLANNASYLTQIVQIHLKYDFSI